VHSSSDSDGLKTDEDLSMDIEPKGQEVFTGHLTAEALTFGANHKENY